MIYYYFIFCRKESDVNDRAIIKPRNADDLKTHEEESENEALNTPEVNTDFNDVEGSFP